MSTLHRSIPETGQASRAVSEAQPPAPPLRSSKPPATLPQPLASERFLDFAWQKRRWLCLIVFVLYLAGFNGQWRLEPDAALYLSLGRNLAEGHGYVYMGHPHHLAYPGLPWLIAGLFKVFGADTLVPIHVAMLLITGITLLLTYRLFALHANRRTALVVMLGVAITKTFYRYAFEIRSDMPFLLGVMAFLAGYEAIWPRRPSDTVSSPPSRIARWYDWTLLGSGLFIAIVTRPTMWALLLAATGAIIYVAMRRRRTLRSVLLLAAVLALTAIAFYACDPRRAGAGEGSMDQYEGYVLQQWFDKPIPAVIHNLGNNLWQLLSLATTDAMFQVRLGSINVVLSLSIILLGILLFRRRIMWGLWVTLTIAMIVAILPLDRYYLQVLPLLAYAWWLGITWLNRHLPRRLGNCLFLGLLALGTLPNFTKCGGIVMQQRRTPFLQNYEQGQFVPLEALATQIRSHTPENAVILMRMQHPGPPQPVGAARIMTFLSHRDVADYRDNDLIDYAHRPIYLVTPADPQDLDCLTQAHLTIDPPIAQVPTRTGTYTLHPTQRIP